VFWAGSSVLIAECIFKSIYNLHIHFAYTVDATCFLFVLMGSATSLYSRFSPSILPPLPPRVLVLHVGSGKGPTDFVRALSRARVEGLKEGWARVVTFQCASPSPRLLISCDSSAL
jgi:hypothetical protein